MLQYALNHNDVTKVNLQAQVSHQQRLNQQHTCTSLARPLPAY
jgi:hypothetical protein